MTKSTTQTYRFVGTSANIFDYGGELSRFGQTVELEPAIAEHFIAHGVALLPSEIFDSIGFTDLELRTYFHVNVHGGADDAFLAKRNAAWAHVHDLQHGA